MMNEQDVINILAQKKGLDPTFLSNVTDQQVQPQGTFFDQANQQVADTINQPNSYDARVQDALNNPIVPQSQPTQDMSGKLATLRDNLTTGMRNLATGFKDNYNNDLENGDLMNGRTAENKGAAQRAGEFLGTAGRVIQHPAVGGLIAALVAKKANPGGGWRNAGNVGLDMAKYLGNMRGNQNVLQTMGYNVPNGGIFSGVSDAAMKATINDYYNRGRVTNTATGNIIKQQDVDQKGEKIKNDYELGKERNANQASHYKAQEEYWKGIIKNGGANAAANMLRAQADMLSAKNGRGTSVSSLKYEDKKAFQDNLSKYIGYIKQYENGQISDDKMSAIENWMLQEHGTDFLGFIDKYNKVSGE